MSGGSVHGGLVHGGLVTSGLGGLVRRAGVPMLFLALLVAVLLGVTGCSDRARRLTPAEILEYKRGLVTAHRSEIYPAQAEKLMFAPGQNEVEIDAVFEKLLEEAAAERKAAETDAARQRSGSSGASRTPAGPGALPVSGGSASGPGAP